MHRARDSNSDKIYYPKIVRKNNNEHLGLVLNAIENGKRSRLSSVNSSFSSYNGDPEEEMKEGYLTTLDVDGQS